LPSPSPFTAPASAFALSTGPSEIGARYDAVDGRARSDAGERHFQRTRSMPAVRNAPKVAVESRKWVSPDMFFVGRRPYATDVPERKFDLKRE